MWSLAVTCLLLVGTGCREVTRVKECRKAVATVNRGVLQLKELNRQNEKGAVAESYGELAKEYESFAKELTRLKLNDVHLKGAISNYVTNVRTAATQSRDFGKQLTKLNEAKAKKNKKKERDAERKLKKARTRMSHVVKSQRGHRKRINSLCQPK